MHLFILLENDLLHIFETFLHVEPERNPEHRVSHSSISYSKAVPNNVVKP